MYRYYRFFTFLLSSLICLSSLVFAEVPLIPRTVLFGNPEKMLVRLSPDGTHIAYVSPYNNVANIWIKNLNGEEAAQVITQDTNRGINAYAWSVDGKNLLYIQDKDGDENWRLYAVSIETKEVRCYTPFDKVQARIVAAHQDLPDILIIALNKDNPALHDLYKLTLSTGELQLIEKNPGNVIACICDKDLNAKASVAMLPDGGTQVLLKDGAGTWKECIRWSAEDSTHSGPLHFSYDGATLYLLDAKDSNTTRLAKLDIATNTLSYILDDPIYDISSIAVRLDTLEIMAVSFEKERPEWVFFDKELESIYNYLKTINKGDIIYLGADSKFKKSLIAFYNDNQPVDYYLFDHKEKSAQFLFTSQEDLKKYPLATMSPINVTSRDGLSLHGYLTLPKSYEQKPVPMVLLVHGGPWLRDSWGYNPEVQWLANRGYAVLQINYRGSAGYGKSFMHASFKEWGANMQNDLVDAVKWAIKENIADPKKIAIYGGSYGGYAALAGATDNQDIFCCAIDIFGPSNLLTFLETIPPYWKPFIEFMHKAIGNPITDRELLIKCSPYFKADTIKIPLLIAQGANDPRVKQAESEQIAQALKEHNIPHEYLLFPDEGHGFVKPENRFTFYAAAEKFLATHLGGHYES